MALPTTYDATATVTRVLVARQRLFDVVVDGMREAGRILTAEQIEAFLPDLRLAIDIPRRLTARPGAASIRSTDLDD